MKKRIFITLGIMALCAAGYIVFQASKPAKADLRPHYSAEQLQYLESAGFGQSKTLDLEDGYDPAVHPDRIKYYEDMYGLRYYSQDGLSRLMNTFGYVKGNAGDFTGEIPVANIAEMKAGLAKITPAAQRTFYYFNDDFYAGNSLECIPKSEILPEALRQLDADAPLVWLGGSLIKDTYSSRYPGQALVLHKGTTSKDVQKTYPLFVVAPVDEFNMAGKEVVNGEVKAVRRDPMILAEVDDGYLVLTKW